MDRPAAGSGGSAVSAQRPRRCRLRSEQHRAREARTAPPPDFSRRFDGSPSLQPADFKAIPSALRSHRLAVRTWPSQGRNRGSIPLGSANDFSGLARFRGRLPQRFSNFSPTGNTNSPRPVMQRVIVLRAIMGARKLRWTRRLGRTIMTGRPMPVSIPTEVVGPNSGPLNKFKLFQYLKWNVLSRRLFCSAAKDIMASSFKQKGAPSKRVRLRSFMCSSTRRTP